MFKRFLKWERNLKFGIELYMMLVKSIRSEWYVISFSDINNFFFLLKHNLCCDNCHSHVAFALNLMRYNGSSSWNMIKLAILLFFKGKYVSFGGFLKQWLPFLIMISIVLVIVLASKLGTK